MKTPTYITLRGAIVYDFELDHKLGLLVDGQVLMTLDQLIFAALRLEEDKPITTSDSHIDPLAEGIDDNPYTGAS